MICAECLACLATKLGGAGGSSHHSTAAGGGGGSSHHSTLPCLAVCQERLKAANLLVAAIPSDLAPEDDEAAKLIREAAALLATRVP